MTRSAWVTPNCCARCGSTRWAATASSAIDAAHAHYRLAGDELRTRVAATWAACVQATADPDDAERALGRGAARPRGLAARGPGHLRRRRDRHAGLAAQRSGGRDRGLSARLRRGAALGPAAVGGDAGAEHRHRVQHPQRPRRRAGLGRARAHAGAAHRLAAHHRLVPDADRVDPARAEARRRGDDAAARRPAAAAGHRRLAQPRAGLPDPGRSGARAAARRRSAGLEQHRAGAARTAWTFPISCAARCASRRSRCRAWAASTKPCRRRAEALRRVRDAQRLAACGHRAPRAGRDRAHVEAGAAGRLERRQRHHPSPGAGAGAGRAAARLSGAGRLAGRVVGGARGGRTRRARTGVRTPGIAGAPAGAGTPRRRHGHRAGGAPPHRARRGRGAAPAGAGRGERVARATDLDPGRAGEGAPAIVAGARRQDGRGGPAGQRRGARDEPPGGHLAAARRSAGRAAARCRRRRAQHAAQPGRRDAAAAAVRRPAARLRARRAAAPGRARVARRDGRCAPVVRAAPGHRSGGLSGRVARAHRAGRSAAAGAGGGQPGVQCGRRDGGPRRARDPRARRQRRRRRGAAHRRQRAGPVAVGARTAVRALLHHQARRQGARSGPRAERRIVGRDGWAHPRRQPRRGGARFTIQLRAG